MNPELWGKLNTVVSGDSHSATAVLVLIVLCHSTAPASGLAAARTAKFDSKNEEKLHRWLLHYFQRFLCDHLASPSNIGNTSGGLVSSPKFSLEHFLSQLITATN